MLKARVLTALALLCALLGVLFLLPPPAVAAAFGLVAAVAAWEWAGLMRIDTAGRVLYAVLVSAFCWQTYVLGAAAFLLFWAAAAGFWLLAAAFWLRRRWSMAANDLLGYALGVLLIVATWAAMVALHGRGPWVLIGVMAVAWVADIAAYFTGRACGRRKLAPSISPGKTWEGVAGALAGVFIYGLGIAVATGYLVTASLAGVVVAALCLALLTALGIAGDLFESLLKRQAGIKDSSNLLPGHGGVLDRIDSLMAILPLAALMLQWSSQ
ncbi:MAG: phosphatidate cytidylyltransferase [Rhodocyclaceae bacterium]|nr:phosphatidate cytidylyltransferase [Rhodocyclaceae bacterium]